MYFKFVSGMRNCSALFFVKPLDKIDQSTIYHHSPWQLDFLAALTNQTIDFRIEDTSTVLLNKLIAINLCNISAVDDQVFSFKERDQVKLQSIKIINLWEDVWLKKRNLVLARLHSLLGANHRVHGRKTNVVKITKPIADLFLKENHLLGAVGSRYKYALLLEDEIIAVATFSAMRKMDHTENYRSIELIRFATKAGYSVVGGLSKLIKAVRKDLEPNDVMTYADCDWSGGEAYIKLGFKYISNLKPQYFLLDCNFNRKLDKNNQISGRRVFNSGSLKFILTF